MSWEQLIKLTSLIILIFMSMQGMCGDDLISTSEIVKVGVCGTLPGAP